MPSLMIELLMGRWDFWWLTHELAKHHSISNDGEDPFRGLLYSEGTSWLTDSCNMPYPLISMHDFIDSVNYEIITNFLYAYDIDSIYKYILKSSSPKQRNPGFLIDKLESSPPLLVKLLLLSYDLDEHTIKGMSFSLLMRLLNIALPNNMSTEDIINIATLIIEWKTIRDINDFLILTKKHPYVSYWIMEIIDPYGVGCSKELVHERQGMVKLMVKHYDHYRFNILSTVVNPRRLQINLDYQLNNSRSRVELLNSRSQLYENSLHTIGNLFTFTMFDPKIGYYSKKVSIADPNNTGPSDFATISKFPSTAFGLLMHLYNIWDSSSRPNPFTVIECGAGNGTLARNINRLAFDLSLHYSAFETSGWSQFKKSLRYVIIEISDLLISKQKKTVEHSLGQYSFYQLDITKTEHVKKISGEIGDCHVVFSIELLDMLRHEKVRLNQHGEVEFGFAIAELTLQNFREIFPNQNIDNEVRLSNYLAGLTDIIVADGGVLVCKTQAELALKKDLYCLTEWHTAWLGLETAFTVAPYLQQLCISKYFKDLVSSLLPAQIRTLSADYEKAISSMLLLTRERGVLMVIDYGPLENIVIPHTRCYGKAEYDNAFRYSLKMGDPSKITRSFHRASEYDVTFDVNWSQLTCLLTEPGNLGKDLTIRIAKDIDFLTPNDLFNKKYLGFNTPPYTHDINYMKISDGGKSLDYVLPYVCNVLWATPKLIDDNISQIVPSGKLLFNEYMGNSALTDLIRTTTGGRLLFLFIDTMMRMSFFVPYQRNTNDNQENFDRRWGIIKYKPSDLSLFASPHRLSRSEHSSTTLDLVEEKAFQVN